MADDGQSALFGRAVAARQDGWQVDHQAVTNTLAQLLRKSTEDVERDVMTSQIGDATANLLGLVGAGVMVIDTDGNRHTNAVSEAARDMDKL